MVIDLDGQVVRMSWGEYRRELASGRIRRAIGDARRFWWVRRQATRRDPELMYRALVRPDFADPLDLSRPAAAVLDAQVSAVPAQGSFAAVLFGD